RVLERRAGKGDARGYCRTSARFADGVVKEGAPPCPEAARYQPASSRHAPAVSWIGVALPQAQRPAPRGVRQARRYATPKWASTQPWYVATQRRASANAAQASRHSPGVIGARTLVAWSGTQESGSIRTPSVRRGSNPSRRT